MKKGTTKSAARRPKGSTTLSVEEFSELLLKVINHPACPENMLDAICDELTDMLRVDWREPKFVLQALKDARTSPERRAKR